MSQIKVDIETISARGKTYVDVMGIISVLLKLGHTELAQAFANLKISENP